jgi:hypothetical protein
MAYIVTLDLRLEMVFGEGLEPSSQSARKREENIRLLRNGQKDGLRSRDTMLPEHVLYLAELLPD